MENLYVGPVQAALDLPRVQENNIKLIINLAAEEYRRIEDVAYLKIEVIKIRYQFGIEFCFSPTHKIKA